VALCGPIASTMHAAPGRPAYMSSTAPQCSLCRATESLQKQLLKIPVPGATSIEYRLSLKSLAICPAKGTPSRSPAFCRWSLPGHKIAAACSYASIGTLLILGRWCDLCPQYLKAISSASICASRHPIQHHQWPTLQAGQGRSETLSTQRQ
jgi:hypothetical protein